MRSAYFFSFVGGGFENAERRVIRASNFDLAAYSLADPLGHMARLLPGPKPAQRRRNNALLEEGIYSILTGIRRRRVAVLMWRDRPIAAVTTARAL